MAVEQYERVTGAVAAPHSRRHRPLLALLAVLPLVLAVVAGATWLFAVQPPQLAQGSTSTSGDLVPDGDSVGQTRWLLPAGQAEATRLVSVRNDSRWTVRLSTEARDQQYRLARAVGLWRLDPLGGFDPSDARRSAVRLGPGEQAGVELHVDGGCAELAAGSAVTLSSFPLVVEALGKRAERDVPLDLPVTVVGPRGASCPR